MKFLDIVAWALIAFVVSIPIWLPFWLYSSRDVQTVARGKVDRENVLVVFPEQLRQ